MLDHQPRSAPLCRAGEAPFLSAGAADSTQGGGLPCLQLRDEAIELAALEVAGLAFGSQLRPRGRRSGGGSQRGRRRADRRTRLRVRLRSGFIPSLQPIRRLRLHRRSGRRSWRSPPGRANWAGESAPMVRRGPSTVDTLAEPRRAEQKGVSTVTRKTVTRSANAGLEHRGGHRTALS